MAETQQLQVNGVESFKVNNTQLEDQLQTDNLQLQLAAGDYYEPSTSKLDQLGDDLGWKVFFPRGSFFRLLGGLGWGHKGFRPI